MTTRIFLIDVPRALAAHGVTLSYHRAWRYAVEGRMPAERINGKWTVEAANLPEIAASLTGKK